MKNDPQFVIGIGSQRAGSTLLHKVLDECTEVFMHPVKELHYFDTIFGVRSPEVLIEFSNRQLDRELDRLISAKGLAYIDNRYKCFIRANKILSKKLTSDVSYHDLFRPCINGNKYLGEVTPEYMVLPEKGVSFMASLLGSSAKVILVARDPVERFISAFKLLKFYDNPHYKTENFSAELEETIRLMPSWIQQQEQLNDYESAMVKYEKHFDNVLFLSLEKMISDPKELVEDLEEFLGMKVDEEKVRTVFSGKVNSLSQTGAVDAKVRSELVGRFKYNAEYLNEYFGETIY